MKTAVKSEDLADVPSQDIKTSAYTLTMDKDRLMTDELGWSRKWMDANLTGIGGRHSVTLTWDADNGVDGYNVYRSAVSGGPYAKIAGLVTSPTYVDRAVNPQQVWYYVVTALSGENESSYSTEVSATVPGSWVYVYAGNYEDVPTEAIAAAAGFAGARGSSTMQPSPNAATVAATGLNVQSILSQGVQNLTDAQFADKLRAMVFKSAVWGVPFGIFFHLDELSDHQVSIMLKTLKSAGATLMNNTQLVDYLRSTLQDFGTTYYADSASGAPLDARPTAASPVVRQGATLADEYKFDLLGIDESQFAGGWGIGAMVYVPESPGQAK
jgi:hypothetical protein